MFKRAGLRTFTSHAVLAGTLIAITAVDPAWAEQSGTESADASISSPTTSNDDIVVTAQFRSQRLQDTPLAITAVNAAALESRSQTTITEIAEQSPSLTLKNQSPSMGPSLAATMRGIGQYDFNPALEPGVGFYVDDVYFATLTGSIVDLLDLDRVEILRGPQGTLAGRNSIGGAVKLFSLKPEGTNSGYISVAAGSRSRLDLRGSFDTKITDDLFLRVAGVAKRQDGYIERIDFGCAFPGSGVPAKLAVGTGCVVDKMGGVGYQALRGSLRYTGIDGLDLALTGDYTREDRTTTPNVLTSFTYNTASPNLALITNLPSGFDYQQFLTPKGGYHTYAGFSNMATGMLSETTAPDRVDFKGGGVSLNIDYALGDTLSLKSISAYRGYYTRFGSDDDGSPLSLSVSDNRLSFWSISQELRLSGSVSSLIDYTVGGFYMKQKSVATLTADVRYGGVPLAFLALREPVPAQSKAAFAQLIFHPLPDLNVTGGLRYTDEKKDYTFYRYNKDGSYNPFLSPNNGVTGSYRGDRWDYRIAVDYRWAPWLMTYAQIATGYKGGGINPRPFTPIQVVSFTPETLTSYEAGAKMDIFDRKVRFNVSAYHSIYKDIQTTITQCPPSLGNPCIATTNAGDARIDGFEAETTVRPIQALTFDAAASYTDFQYKSLLPFAVQSGLQLGFKPINTPKWKYSFGVQYEINFNDVWKLTPRFDGSYQSLSFGRVQNAPRNRIESRFLANGRLTLTNEESDWQISAEVTNIFKKYYYVSNLDINQGYVPSTPGRPREWGITIKKSFR
ncbi:iron complex outermembrane recepter protein [Sphingobium sp. AP50]|uniref:TonB-dependent receptor n=1 Tax=Sphingobium sp. AP50 TaxID=1884369 RepID=UPI0008C17FC5|nr:TonB-dependent receptor [Sphingobium sp. AP50]SEJ99081.1 iron complex outermembrane recepter protein [Sphingobium sp. AP50]